MKHFKQVLSALLAGAATLVLLAGCSQSGACTLNGTITIRQNSETILTDAPITIAADGSKTYMRYEIEGYTVETLSDSSASYERVYATGTASTKWSKSAASGSSVSASTESKTGAMTIDGTEYTTLTYDDVTFYCYKDSSLACIYSNTGTEETIIKISTISTEVDSNLLKAPSASEIETVA